MNYFYPHCSTSALPLVPPCQLRAADAPAGPAGRGTCEADYRPRAARRVRGGKGVTVGVTMHGWSGRRGPSPSTSSFGSAGGSVRINAGQHIGGIAARSAAGVRRLPQPRAPRRTTGGPHDMSIFVIDGPRSFVVTGSCNIGDDPAVRVRRAPPRRRRPDARNPLPVDVYQPAPRWRSEKISDDRPNSRCGTRGARPSAPCSRA